MFIFTAKISPKKAILCLCLLAVLLISIVLFAGGRSRSSSMRAAEASNLHTETAQAEYLTSLGWEVEPVPIETKTIQLPQKFSPTYESYNALQLQQGYDLTDYRGKEVNRVTFRITNHPSGEKVVADLLICDGKLIGGDVQSPTLNGFMEGLAFPKTEKQTVSVQPEGVTASV